MSKTVHELSSEELEELRENYFTQLEETDSEVLGSIKQASDIPFDVILAHYEGTYFVDEDFFCNLT